MLTLLVPRAIDVRGLKLSREQQDVSPGHGSRQALHARGELRLMLHSYFSEDPRELQICPFLSIFIDVRLGGTKDKVIFNVLNAV